MENRATTGTGCPANSRERLSADAAEVPMNCPWMQITFACLADRLGWRSNAASNPLITGSDVTGPPAPAGVAVQRTAKTVVAAMILFTAELLTVSRSRFIMAAQ